MGCVGRTTSADSATAIRESRDLPGGVFCSKEDRRGTQTGEKAKAKVTVKLTDPAGNRETEKLRVRLK